MTHAMHSYSTHQIDRSVWVTALANLRAADEQFIPIRRAFDNAERAYFDLRKSVLPGEEKSAEVEAAYAAIGLDAATEKERLAADTLYEAASTCFRTPAPDVLAVIEKLEMIEHVGFDGRIEQLILGDLRRFLPDRQERDTSEGQAPLDRGA